MANDKSIGLRVSLLEYQMESLVEMVKEIRANYVTKAELKQILDERLSHFATKEDLHKAVQQMRNWVITVGISLTALQFGMQYALFQLYLHAP